MTAEIITILLFLQCKSGGEFAAGLVYIKWRENITKYLHFHYFNCNTYYKLNVTDRHVDNPDQRITQDVERFCDEVSQALPKLILQPFLIGYYSYKTFISLGWFGVLGIYGFFIVSTVINKFIMGPIVNYVFLQEWREGDFRFHHVQVRSNAEAVAFYMGGNTEGKKSNERLKVLLETMRGSVHWQLPLNFSVFMFDYISTIISYSLVGVAIFTGHYDHLSPPQLASAVSENAFISMYLLNSFSTVVDTAVKFAEIGGYTHRIGQLLQVLKEYEKRKKEKCNEKMKAEDETDQHKQEDKEMCSHLSVHSKEEAWTSDVGELPSSLRKRGFESPYGTDVAAVLRNATIISPHDENPLVEELNLEFRKGVNVIILGETGAGKSSIFRVLRDLWRPVHGFASLLIDQDYDSVMFLPQKSYLTSGCLADQIVFPKCFADFDVNECNEVEDKINECIAIAELIPLKNKLGGLYVQVDENWYDVVTPGEAQRIAFARLFFHRPSFAFLDEVTSALSEDSEEILYQKMIDFDITFMSIGHRSTLAKFHHQVLRILRDHSWTLEDIDQDS